MKQDIGPFNEIIKDREGSQNYGSGAGEIYPIEPD